ncbi:MFS transporter [Halalkalibacter kiskunsagensis]|uniref:MFS transporter n=1 Tax=Halalkalibacter kiskunsagensis TaxID=1548599 RepID=A0ABV6KCU4_9BACI
MRRTNNLLRLMAFMFFCFSAMTIVGTYLPVYFRDNGLSSVEIGWLLGVASLASVIAQPFWAYMSDKYKSIKRILVLCLVFVIGTSVILFHVESLATIAIMMFIFYCFFSPINPLGESLAQKTATEKKISFGKIRVWGSLGFAITALISGYVLAFFGIENILYPFLLVILITFLLAIKLTDINLTDKKATLFTALKIGREPKFLWFLVLALLITIPHRTNDHYLGIYIVELGGSESLIGWAIFIGVITESFVFVLGWLWFRRFHELTFIIIGGSLYSIRWICMTFVLSPESVLFLQFFHGASFGVFYLSAFQYVTKILPKDLLATGHVFFLTVVFGVGGMIGSLGGGLIIEYYGISNMYWWIGILATIGTVSFFFYRLVVVRKEEAVEDTFEIHG